MNAEVAIIGGGLAGSAAAIELARAGCDVLLLEREAGPKQKVCGEFLSQEALSSLSALGVSVSELGAASIHATRLVSGSRVIEKTLPFQAMSLTRARLDETLLEQAAKSGANVLRGVRATNVQGSRDQWCISVEGAEDVNAREVFVATGKHDLPGRPRPSGVQQGFVGFKLHLRLALEQAAALEGHIELTLFRGGYAGLTLVEHGAASLGWIVQRSELQRSGTAEEVLRSMQKECPQLSERLRGAEWLLAKPLAISPIPYGFVRKTAQNGMWSLGDQAAVIPSFTGDGMSIALHSGRLAARMYLAGANAARYQQTLATQLRRQVWLATVISRGLVWAPSRALMIASIAAWPGAIAWATQSTRIAKGAQLDGAGLPS